jgi:hypothetical protein
MHPSSAACVQAARDEFAAQTKSYRDLVGAASKASGMSLVRIDAALAAFEPAFFNNLVLALELRFVHRPPAHGGGALDEVRLLATALTSNGGILATDVPGGSVLGLDAGDRVALNADDFEALCAAFLAGIEQRFAT